MPPTKVRPKPKEADIGAVIALALQNKDEMLRWYRASTSAGHQVGHIVIHELVLTYDLKAWQLALEGKHWEPPAVSP